VCAAYPNLRAGVDAWKLRRRQGEPTHHHGLIAPRPALDPRDNPQRAVSPTQLQTLGTCPLRYHLRYVLRAKKPDDPEFSPEQWLSPIDKGSLLHSVYQRALEDVAGDGLDIAADGFEVRVMDILDDEVDRMRALLPPPGESVFRLEYDNLREDARAFVAMVREEKREFVKFELAFGERGTPPVELQLPDGRRLNVTGRIDRVDRLPDGSLVVVDYKTGSSFSFTEKSRIYDGGRRLQHALYAKAAEQLFGARVARAEYHFPSRKSQNHRAKFEAEQLKFGMQLVSTLLDFVANGWFIPTNVADDCKFCDYALACRTNVDPYGKVVSSMAEWSREADGDAIDMMRLMRR
jgi:ATP-dependent helicase/nuclease subunit B